MIQSSYVNCTVWENLIKLKTCRLTQSLLIKTNDDSRNSVIGSMVVQNIAFSEIQLIGHCVGIKKRKWVTKLRSNQASNTSLNYIMNILRSHFYWRLPGENPAVTGMSKYGRQCLECHIFWSCKTLVGLLQIQFASLASLNYNFQLSRMDNRSIST